MKTRILQFHVNAERQGFKITANYGKQNVEIAEKKSHSLEIKL
jgi:hypothetical protein